MFSDAPNARAAAMRTIGDSSARASRSGSAAVPGSSRASASTDARRTDELASFNRKLTICESSERPMRPMTVATARRTLSAAPSRQAVKSSIALAVTAVPVSGPGAASA